jgi:photosystem II stability/assembly factor-like uncharacterized protein
MTSRWRVETPFPGGTVASLTSATTADGSTVIFAATPLGLFSSADLGEHWRKSSTELDEPWVQEVAASPGFAGDPTLYAATRSTVFRSLDGGKSWKPRLRGRGMTTIALSPEFEEDRTVFAGSDGDGVFRSEDNGETWTSANAGLLELSVQAVSLSPSFSTDKTGFLTTGAAIYRTRNGGKAWREVETGLADLAVQCLAISPDYSSDGVVMAGDEEHGVLVSRDGGATWSVANGAAGEGVASILFVPATDGSRVIASTADGLRVTHDLGETWDVLDASPPMTICLHAAGARHPGFVLAGRYREGISRSQDGGVTWSSASHELRANLIADVVAGHSADGDERMFVLDLEAGVFSSSNGGRDWTPCNQGLEHVDVANLASGSGSYPAFAATTRGVFRYDATAGSWRRSTESDDAIISLTASHRDDGSTLIVGLSTGEMVFVSHDLGEHWSAFDAPGRFWDAAPIAIEPFDHSSQSILLASKHSDSDITTVWRSNDFGSSWERVIDLPVGRIAALTTMNLGGSETILAGVANSLFVIDRADESDPDRREARFAAVDVGDRRTRIVDLLSIPESQCARGSAVVATSSGIYLLDGDDGFRLRRDESTPETVVALSDSVDSSGHVSVIAVELGGAIWRISLDNLVELDGVAVDKSREG